MFPHMVRRIAENLTVLLLAVCFAWPGLAQDPSCLRIGTAFGGKHSVDDLITNNLRDVLATLDICLDMVSGPPKRLTEELLRGELDGELIRIKDYQEIAGDAAVLVEEPLMEILGDLVVRAEIDLSKASLGDLSIGTLRGVKWHDVAAKGARNVFVANDMPQLVSMLLNGRVDGIMVGQLLRQEYPELANLPSQIAYRNTGHFVLHKSHADLADAVSSAIKAFRQRGCSFLEYGGGPKCGNTGELEKPLLPEDRIAAVLLTGS